MTLHSYQDSCIKIAGGEKKVYYVSAAEGKTVQVRLSLVGVTHVTGN